MAEATILELQDQFSCPICLEMMKDPVTVLCGHSFCMKCINDSWDQEDQKGVYSCPQCRQTFTTRPVVSKNTILAEVVETLKKTGLHATPPAQCSAGPEDVDCDSCTEKKHKAIKSCLVCLASYCETHLQPHYKSPAFKKHKLVEASRRLQEQICSQHDKLLEVYCRTDKKCICMLCTMDNHKRHNTVSAAAGRAEKQKQLQEIQRKYQHKIQEREKELHDLTKAVESHKHSAQSAVQECKKIFTDLIKSIERRHCEVTKLIKAQETTAVSRAEEVMKQLEQEITELRKRNAEMEELSHSQDPIYFLQNFQAVLAPMGCDLPTITVHSLLNFENVIKSVSQLRSGLQDLCKDKIKKISSEVKKVRLISPVSREELLECFCQFTLDPETSYPLCVSDEGTVVTNSSPYNYYSSDHNQILCSESVSEPCYWEVEWSGSNGVSIAVSYGDLKTDDCIFGHDDKSWNLQCSSSSCSFFHNNQETNISMSSALLQSGSSKIGVFVDHKAGTLSFYSVSDTMKLIHRVHTTFTQPLYPGFTVNLYSTVKLC